MKAKKTFFSIIVIGLILVAFAMFNYTTANNTDDFSRNDISPKKEQPFVWAPIIGLALLIGGIAVIVPGKLGQV